MKIITKKKADEILKRIIANEIIARKYIDDTDDFENFESNNANIVFEVGGLKGVQKVINTLEKYVGME